MIVSLCMYICTHVTAAHEASLVQVPGHLFFFVTNTTSLDLSKIYHAIIVTSFTSKLNHMFIKFIKMLHLHQGCRCTAIKKNHFNDCL